MKVSYAINARLAGGGIGNTAYQAVRAIHKRGWLEQLLVSSTRTNEFARVDLRSMGIVGRGIKRAANYDASQRLNIWSDVVFDRWAARQLASSDIFHGWQNHALASLGVAKKKGAQTIVERGGSHILKTRSLLEDEFRRWNWNEPGVSEDVVRRALREFGATDFIIVPSQYNFDSFLDQSFPRAKILLLPLGVDTQRFRPQPDVRASPEMFRVLFVGQVSLRKGIQYLLPAWRKAALSKAELVIAGQVKADAAKIVQEYTRDPTIRWVGYVDDPVALYQSADVFAFPSIEEGSALVTYEAMACGVPSIVTYNAGSLVSDAVDGFIVPVRDVDATAEKLCWLKDNPEQRLAMGRAARTAIEPMTWDDYGVRLLDTYCRCLTAKGCAI